MAGGCRRDPVVSPAGLLVQGAGGNRGLTPTAGLVSPSGLIDFDAGRLAGFPGHAFWRNSIRRYALAENLHRRIYPTLSFDGVSRRGFCNVIDLPIVDLGRLIDPPFRR